MVRLSQRAPPGDIPVWLAVQAAAAGVAETAAAYTGDAPPSDDASTVAVGRRPWPWSPYHRESGGSLSEFLDAGDAAVRHPDP